MGPVMRRVATFGLMSALSFGTGAALATLYPPARIVSRFEAEPTTSTEAQAQSDVADQAEPVPPSPAESVAESILRENRGFLETPISREDAEKVLGKPPATMPGFLAHSSAANRMHLLGGTLYQSMDFGSGQRWIGQVWYHEGDTPAFVMVRQMRVPEQVARDTLNDGERTVQLRNGTVAEIGFNTVGEDGKPLRPPWIKHLWHLTWYNDGVLHTVDAANMGLEEVLQIAEAISAERTRVEG